MMPPLPRRSLAVCLAFSLAACSDDLMEPRSAVVDGHAAMAPIASLPVMASQTVGPELLASTRNGELLLIDLFDGSMRKLGEAEAFTAPGEQPFRPSGWTGLARDSTGRVFTLSRTTDDIRPDGCSSNNGSAACTHLYEIDGATGLILHDFGSMGRTNVSDIDFWDGTLYANAVTGNGYGGLLTIDTSTGVATPVGTTFGGAGVGVAWPLANGGISLDPSTGDVWIVENTWAEASRVARVDRTTGAAIAGDIVVLDMPLDAAGKKIGFDALEILPDGRFIASRARNVFEMYEIEREDLGGGELGLPTGVVTLISISIPAGVTAAPTGLDLAPVLAELGPFEVLRADALLHPTKLPGADEITFEANSGIAFGVGGFDPATEALTLSLGNLNFQVAPGAFDEINAGGVLYRFTGSFAGPAVLELRDDGTLFMNATGFSISVADLGAFTAILTVGDEVGTADGVWSTPSGIPAPFDETFLGVTNKGELVRIDLNVQTATLLGTATKDGAMIGWTGVASSPDGQLLVSARWRDGDQADGCEGGYFQSGDGKCAHIYSIDPNTGQIVSEIGNTGVKYLSDLDFRGTALFGSEFQNDKSQGDGGLVTIDPLTGAATRIGEYGVLAGLPVENGGLSADPVTGVLWATESSDATTARIFAVDPASAVPSDARLLKDNGRTLTFGFDGLEILEDGRFYATKARDMNAIYRIDPATGEVRFVPLTMDPLIQGSLTDLSLRRAAQVSGVKDTFLRKKDENLNEGANTRLYLAKDEDIVLGFDVTGVDFAEVESARVVLSIDPDQPPEGLGRKGGKVRLFGLGMDFAEGNGVDRGAAARVGDGQGATWECSVDSDISNEVRDCDKSLRWKSRKSDKSSKSGKSGKSEKSNKQVQEDGVTGEVVFDVTEDLRAGGSLWTLRLDGAKKEARIVYFSKEGAQEEGDARLAPRLIIEYRN